MAVAPADPAEGNVAGPDQLRLASASAETVGDAVARYYVTLSGTDLGLRGGQFHLSATSKGYALHLDALRWTSDLAISGTIDWNQFDGRIASHITLLSPGHAGVLDLAWNDQERDAVVAITGTIDGQAVVARGLAP